MRILNLCFSIVLSLVRPANPGYKVEELAHQLRTTKAALLIAHPLFLNTAQLAARKAGIAQDRIVLMETALRQAHSTFHTTLGELVAFGLQNPTSFSERQFKPGEGRTALAFLSFSSGTTGMYLEFKSYTCSVILVCGLGKPKVRIPQFFSLTTVI